MKKLITYKDIVKMKPCYMPEEIGIPKNYKASIADFIEEYRDKVKDKEDIAWVVCRNDYMSDRDLRLFAVWCAREALKLEGDPDERSVNACDVAERYANGEATDKEFAAARAAAWDAAWAARDAAWATARAARDAAWATARDAAWDARDARAAARAAGDAAGDAQTDKLLTYFK